MHDRGGQFDVAHALTADAAVRHLDAAAVADHSLVLHPAVLPTGAFPVFFGAENSFAEQAVPLGAVRAVIDRLGLLDLAERPAPDVVRAGQADLDSAVIVNAIVSSFSSSAHWVHSWFGGGVGTKPTLARPELPFVSDIVGF